MLNCSECRADIEMGKQYILYGECYCDKCSKSVKLESCEQCFQTADDPRIYALCASQVGVFCWACTGLEEVAERKRSGIQRVTSRDHCAYCCTFGTHVSIWSNAATCSECIKATSYSPEALKRVATTKAGRMRLAEMAKTLAAYAEGEK